jgi:nucleoside-diphosphate-sugar epimerase
MRILITGCTGFVGRELTVRCLAEGFEVRGLTRAPDRAAFLLPERVELVEADLTGPLPPDLWDSVDIVCHCAGEIRDADIMELVNVGGTRSLASGASGRVKRWVQMSSTGVFGYPTHGVITEASPRRPRGLYEKTKYAADCLVKKAAQVGDFDLTILHPCAVVGTGMPNESLRVLARTVRAGRFFHIGNPSSSFLNYVPVENVVDAIMLCVANPASSGRSFIVADCICVRALLESIAAGVGVPPSFPTVPAWLAGLAALPSLFVKRYPLTFSRVRALTSRAIFSTALAEVRLGYRNRVSLPDAVRRIAAVAVGAHDAS